MTTAATEVVTAVEKGVWRSPHAADIPFAFGNLACARDMTGPGPAPDEVARNLMSAFVAFARTGDPSSQGLAWPRYDTTARKTMIFNVPSHVVADPDRDRRLFWMA